MMFNPTKASSPAPQLHPERYKPPHATRPVAKSSSHYIPWLPYVWEPNPNLYLTLGNWRVANCQGQVGPWRSLVGGAPPCSEKSSGTCSKLLNSITAEIVRSSHWTTVPTSTSTKHSICTNCAAEFPQPFDRLRSCAPGSAGTVPNFLRSSTTFCARITLVPHGESFSVNCSQPELPPGPSQVSSDQLSPSTRHKLPRSALSYYHSQ